MRVALLTYSTRPRGGVVHTLALAEALAARGHEVEVWSLGRGGDAAFFRPVADDVAVRLVPFPEVAGEAVGDRILRSIAVLRQAFPSGDAFDVVHAQDCISANAVLDRPGLVRTVHHLDSFTTPELVACHDRAVAVPATLVCVSSSVAAEVDAGWGRTATVIPNGVDAQRFSDAAGPAGAPARAAWRQRLGSYVLALGGIEPRKGTLGLVEAMALLRRTHPAVSLVVGGGETLFDYREYRERVETRALDLGLRPLVLGALAHDDVPPLVAAASAFAFPSTKEGFGLAAMEALAAGVPLVLSDLPVLREVFDGAGLFAADPPALAAALATALDGGGPGPDVGRRLAAAHTWAAAAAAHERLYASL